MSYLSAHLIAKQECSSALSWRINCGLLQPSAQDWVSSSFEAQHHSPELTAEDEEDTVGLARVLDLGQERGVEAEAESDLFGDCGEKRDHGHLDGRFTPD